MLDRVGTGRYGRAEVHATIGLTMVDAEAAFRTQEGVAARTSVEMSKRELTAARGFLREAVHRYLPLGMIPGAIESERHMGSPPEEARTLLSRLRDASVAAGS